MINYLFLICFHLEWFIFLTTAFKIGILEKLNESQSHRMHEGGNHTKAEIDAVSEEENQQHWKPTHCPRHAFGELESELVEHTTQHTTSQTECKQTDITEKVSEKTCCHAVGVPKARTKIHEDVLVWTIEEEDA